MASQRLTDQSAISLVNKDDLIHVVDVSDVSSNPAGTSKKATISQILSGSNLLGLHARSDTPSDPTNNTSIFWQDTNNGNIMSKINHNGTVKTAVVLEYSTI